MRIQLHWQLHLIICKIAVNLIITIELNLEPSHSSYFQKILEEIETQGVNQSSNSIRKNNESTVTQRVD